MLRKTCKAPLWEEIEKRGVAVDGIGFNTASIIDEMAIVQKLNIKHSLIMQNQYSQESLLVWNNVNALM